MRRYIDMLWMMCIVLAIVAYIYSDKPMVWRLSNYYETNYELIYMEPMEGIPASEAFVGDELVGAKASNMNRPDGILMRGLLVR